MIIEFVLGEKWGLKQLEMLLTLQYLRLSSFFSFNIPKFCFVKTVRVPRLPNALVTQNSKQAYFGSRLLASEDQKCFVTSAQCCASRLSAHSSPFFVYAGRTLHSRHCIFDYQLLSTPRSVQDESSDILRDPVLSSSRLHHRR